MPPVENNTHAQEPKKPGLFARLFGKKKDGAALSQPVVSQTPPPQLNDTPSNPTPVASVGNDIVSATPVSSSMPVMPVTAPVTSLVGTEGAVSSSSVTPSVQPTDTDLQPTEGSPLSVASPSTIQEDSATGFGVSPIATDQTEPASTDQDKPLTPQNPFT